MPRKILVVDDDPVVLRGIVRSLERRYGPQGFEVLQAPDLIGAMDRLTDTDGLVQDLALIVCDGLGGDYAYLRDWALQGQVPFFLFSGTSPFVQKELVRDHPLVKAAVKPDMDGFRQGCQDLLFPS